MSMGKNAMKKNCKVESDVKFDTIGNFDPTKTYYVTLRMPRSTGYELQEFL